MRIRNIEDFLAGVLFLVVGAVFGVGATTYEIGSADQMGPGYFPLLCGGLLVIIGLVVCIRSLVVGTPGRDPAGRSSLRPLALVIGANMLFGILLAGSPLLGIPALGLFVATPVLVLVSAWAGREYRFWEVCLLAVVLTLGVWLLFARGLGMPLPVWPESWIG